MVVNFTYLVKGKPHEAVPPSDWPVGISVGHVGHVLVNGGGRGSTLCAEPSVGRWSWSL